MAEISKEEYMLGKNQIIDIIDAFREEKMGRLEMIWIIEYVLDIRDTIVIMRGETDDENMGYIVGCCDDDYILNHEGNVIITKKYEKLKNILDVIDDEVKLAMLLGTPECCIKKWKSLKDREETAIHNSTMKKYFGYLPYTPCSSDCKESINRENRLKKIIEGNNIFFEEVGK